MVSRVVLLEVSVIVFLSWVGFGVVMVALVCATMMFSLLVVQV